MNPIFLPVAATVVASVAASEEALLASNYWIVGATIALTVATALAFVVTLVLVRVTLRDARKSDGDKIDRLIDVLEHQTNNEQLFAHGATVEQVTAANVAEDEAEEEAR